MSEPLPRPIKTIDADLRSCRALRRDAEMELTQVRRRQLELVELEATLLSVIDMRRWRTDRLLDERLLTVTVAGRRRPGGPEQQHDRRITDLDSVEEAWPIRR